MRVEFTFASQDNILYAHSRLDKTMFGSLSKTLKADWYRQKSNQIIRVSTELENTMWQIFSVYKIKEEGYYITTDFYDESDFLEFVNKLKERSVYDFGVSFLESDRILTLSTCYSDTERLVVHSKLIKVSKR